VGRYPEALAVARRSADLLPRYGGNAALRRAVEEQVADLDLLCKLDAAWLAGAAVKNDGSGFDDALCVPLFRQAFLEYGIDILAGDGSAVAEQLRRRLIRTEIAAALEEWLRLATDREDRQRLFQVLEVLEPEGIAARIRRAGAVQDTEALKRLAAEAASEAPPPVLVRLAKELEAASAPAEAERLLRAGLNRYPGEFWLNYWLFHIIGGANDGDTIKPDRMAEQLRFAQAAVALRPNSPGAWLNVGKALLDLGRSEDAAITARRAIELKPDYALAYHNLSITLRKLGRPREAETALRRFVELKPEDAEHHNTLGTLLCEELHKPAEAEAPFRRAIALKPNEDSYHHNLGVALSALGRHKEAEAAFRQAIQLAPDDATYHYALGIGLERQRRLAEAEAVYRQAIELKTDYAEAHYDLGNVLRDLRRREEAIEMYRRAIALRPDYAEAHCNLGQELKRKGDFSQAVAELRVGHQLGSKRKDWPDPSAERLREAELFAAAEAKLPRVLAGEVPPGDAAECLTLAQLCQNYKKRYAAAARFYAGAFAAASKLADVQNVHRYNAACVAALASCGQGNDASKVEDAERARLRRQALNWLGADLTAWAKLADNATDRPRVRQQMQYWRRDRDLAGVRDAAALDKLPEAERAEWQKFWTEVAELLKRTEEAKPPGGSPPTR
jgi:tetratricopeptide (TPR) repeat protein